MSSGDRQSPQPCSSWSSRRRIALSLLASSRCVYYRVWILHVRRRCSCNSSRPHYLMGFTATGPSIQEMTHFMQLTLMQQRPARLQLLIADRIVCKAFCLFVQRIEQFTHTVSNKTVSGSFTRAVTLLSYISRRRLRWSSGIVLAFSTQVRGFKPGPKRRIFWGRKNPQHAFLRRGSKAVGPMS